MESASVNVLSGGLTAGGGFDNSAALTALLSSRPAGSRLHFPPGTYLIGATVSATLTSALHLDLSPGAELVGTAADRGPMLSLRQDANRSRIVVTGGAIDNADRPYVAAAQSGTALSLSNAGEVIVSGVRFGRRAQVSTVPFGDSGLTAVNCDRLIVSGNWFYGQPDLGVYLSGGGLADAGDDHSDAIIVNNHFIACGGGVSIKRALKRSIILGNTFVDCAYGALAQPAMSGAATLAAGSVGVIANNIFKRTATYAIQLWPGVGWSITSNVIEDFGSRGIYLMGASSCNVSNNTIRSSEWATHPAQCAIALGPNPPYNGVLPVVQPSNNTIRNNTISNVHTGYSERGTGQNNVWEDNTLFAVTQPVGTLPSDRKWHYSTGNLDHRGIGAVPYEGSWTPIAQLSGLAPAISYIAQSGRYVRQGNLVTVWGKLQATITHAGGAGNEFRIAGLPYVARTGLNHVGVMGYTDNYIRPANLQTLVPKVINNTSRVRFDGLLTNASPAILNAANIPSGTACRWEFGLTYEV